MLEPEQRFVSGAVLAILVGCLVLLSTLSVKVGSETLIVSFGPGLIRKKFAIRDIRTARAVRNPWYYGWGIRLTPHGWMFNISGLDAVELELTNGRKFRIGTDDPLNLVAAIQSARR
ncbi:hypothetical protein JW992_04635 [candidate division KSB1 bacterium]|nr:hypothetical protein [candidate division KSB1 bacterium]